MKTSATFTTLVLSALFLISEWNCKSESNLSVSNYPVEDSLTVRTALPGNIDESSGIVYLGNRIWTHNDSGDAPRLYEVSTTKKQLFRTVWVDGADNEDWEDIASDDRYVYIGDFGNNSGNRTDLVVYKVSKDSLVKAGNFVVDSEPIYFYYPDQVNYDPGAYNHNFDCEAMISVGDSLYLFSKNHLDGQCRLYALPKTPGNYSARLIGQVDTDGGITAAGYDPENGVVALLGYNVTDRIFARSFQPFVWLLYQYPGRDFFSGKKVRVDIPKILQMEGISYYRDGQFFITCESGSQGDGAVYLWNAKRWY
ncbi:MAG: hypothetical protein IPJ40_23100 [Saprospirales bacterium]|nr:hypothetical protein [Saprospirales bacterium]